MQERKAKPVYERPSFLSAPIAVICSKTGCPGHVVSSMEKVAFEKQKELSKESMPVLPEDFSSRSDEGRMYVFEPSLQKIFELNDTGRFILSQIDGKSSFSKISEKVKSAFADTPENVVYEVISFINALRNASMKIMIKAK